MGTEGSSADGGNGSLSLPLAAVCTPVYNGGAYLDETMACVQAQTYPNLVHVVLDNCSSDRTAEIIEKHKGGRVPIITARNDALLPVAKNWNKCLTLMPPDAAYFRVLCADDLIAPETMELMIAVGERDPRIGVIACGVKLGDQIMDRWPEGESFDGKEATRAYFKEEMSIVAPHVMFRRRRYDRAPGHFFNDKNFHSDMECVLQTLASERIGYVHKVLAYNRVHQDSLTTTVANKERIHRAEWLTWLATYGADAMPAEEVADLRRRFQRFYFRSLLRWQFIDGNAALTAKHVAKLGEAGIHPRALDYVDAALDWPLKKIGLRPGWSRYPY